jgi:probable HAF family extracellular repeat protein
MRHFILLTALGALFTSAASASHRYSLTDLGTLGGEESEAHAINESGQIVGMSQRADGIYRAFLYQNGQMADLGTVGTDDSSAAYAINSSGQITGFSSNTQNETSQIFLYSGGTMAGIGMFGDDDGMSRTIIAGIDDAGEIAVSTGLSDGDGSGDRGSLYTNGEFQILPVPAMVRPVAIDRQGRIFGYGFIGANDAPRFYDHGKVTYLSAIERARGNPTAINDLGEVFGTLAGSNFFVYRHGKVELLKAQWKGNVVAANNHGDFIGMARFSKNRPKEPFLFSDGREVSLAGILTGPTALGWRLTGVTGINDAGQIIGYGVTRAGTTHAFRLDPPPIVTIAGPLRITTSRSNITLRGKATGSPDHVYATVGRQRRHGQFRVVGLTRWHVNFPLHKGINYLNIRAETAANTSTTARVVVVRR